MVCYPDCLPRMSFHRISPENPFMSACGSGSPKVGHASQAVGEDENDLHFCFSGSSSPERVMRPEMRILLLEDEPKVSALVKRGLTAERYAVDVTADGREGLEYTEAYPYDLILLDLMLPSLSGVEVLQRIRRNNQYVPILVLTARDSIDDKVRLFEIGADDYLTKPFAFAELLVRVKALLRRGPVNRSSTLRIGDLELDRLTQQVKRLRACRTCWCGRA